MEIDLQRRKALAKAVERALWGECECECECDNDLNRGGKEEGAYSIIR